MPQTSLVWSNFHIYFTLSQIIDSQFNCKSVIGHFYSSIICDVLILSVIGCHCVILQSHVIFWRFQEEKRCSPPTVHWFILEEVCNKEALQTSQKQIIFVKTRNLEFKMSCDPNKLSNVTLVPVDNTKNSNIKVCQYSQCGFCKFGDKCRKLHVSELCNNLHCDKKLCEKRHPKECKYFSTNSTCKFGKHCADKHVESNEQTYIKELSNDLKSLTSTIKEMANQIY